MAYTDKPVTLADVMNIRGESLMPPMLQPNEEQSSLDDNNELDIGRPWHSQTTTPEVPASAASDKKRPISVGKKKLVFLSEWPQERSNSESDFALKQLVEVCTTLLSSVCVFLLTIIPFIISYSLFVLAISQE